jgi:hypothetical protein
MGTTRREASCSSGQRSVISTLFASRTMRELGMVFQLRRMPSRSSTSLHWSFNASKSAILGCGCACCRCGGLVVGQAAPTVGIGGAVRAVADRGVGSREEV